MNEISGELRNDRGDIVVISSRDGDYDVQFISASPHRLITDTYYVHADNMFDDIREFLIND